MQELINELIHLGHCKTELAAIKIVENMRQTVQVGKEEPETVLWEYGLSEDMAINLIF